MTAAKGGARRAMASRVPLRAMAAAMRAVCKETSAWTPPSAPQPQVLPTVRSPRDSPRGGAPCAGALSRAWNPGVRT